MAHRILLFSVAALAAFAAGCGSDAPKGSPAPLRGPDAVDIVQQIAPPNPPTNFVDDSNSCRDDGCLQMIVTPTVTVSMWPDEQAAAGWKTRHESTGELRRVGRFVLSFTGGQLTLTAEPTRTTLTERARKLSQQ